MSNLEGAAGGIVVFKSATRSTGGNFSTSTRFVSFTKNNGAGDVAWIPASKDDTLDSAALDPGAGSWIRSSVNVGSGAIGPPLETWSLAPTSW